MSRGSRSSREIGSNTDGVPEGFSYRAGMTDRSEQDATNPELVIARVEAQLKDPIIDSHLRLQLETTLEYARRDLENRNKNLKKRVN